MLYNDLLSFEGFSAAAFFVRALYKRIEKNERIYIYISIYCIFSLFVFILFSKEKRNERKIKKKKKKSKNVDNMKCNKFKGMRNHTLQKRMKGPLIGTTTLD